MENVKHYFRNNAIVLNEKSKDYFTFLRQMMPCFFLEHMLIIWQRFIKPLHSSYILIQRLSSFTNESHNLRWAILWDSNSCLFTIIVQDTNQFL